MTKSFWLDVNAENAGNKILTGYIDRLEDMPVWQEFVQVLGSGENALDFGCGIGRYSKELSYKFKNVIGYDLMPMLELIPDNNKLDNIIYTSNWDELKTNKFDVIVASLVFQHIDYAELNSYLEDMSKMTKKIVLGSRTWLDDTNHSVLEVVSQYFDINIIGPISGDHFISILNSRNP
jgi:2-polyprenyl-3-methyl-5-hydroxy-6-metoxy-1,4-benzoquinol methylase